MAETLSSRFGLRNWGADTDGPSRIEFNSNFSTLETNAAMYGQGILASRPAAGKAGRFYMVIGDSTAANNGILWYDNGSGWTQVGVAQNMTVRSTAAGLVPLTVQGFASQTANLQEWKNSAGTVVAYISATGELSVNGAAYAGGTTLEDLTVTDDLTVGGDFTGAAASFSGNVTASKIKSTANRADGNPKWELNVDGTIGGLFPVGMVVMTAASAAPAGWLLCQGQSLSRSAYADLFAAIGTTYGSADGTTFYLPDFRNRMPIGAEGTGVHALGTSDAQSAGANRIARWNHTHTHTATGAGGSITTSTDGGHTVSISGSTSSDGSHSHSLSISSDGGQTITTITGFAGSGTTSGPSGAVGATSGSGVSPAGGSHTHTISDHSHSINIGTTNHSHAGSSATSGGSHSHAWGGTSGTVGSHSHTAAVGSVTVTVNNATVNDLHAYQTVNYMIKT